MDRAHRVTSVDPCGPARDQVVSSFGLLAPSLTSCAFAREESRPMSKRYPCGGLGRRQFLAGAGALPVLAGLHPSAREPRAAAGKAALDGPLGVPGPYPGRVIEVRNPAMIRHDKKDRDAIRAAVARGMKEL